MIDCRCHGRVLDQCCTSLVGKSVTKQIAFPIDVEYEMCLVTDILTDILLCVQQKKDIYIGLEKPES